MSEHFISIEQAENDLFAAAAYLAERIKSGDGRAEAMKAIVPRYLAKGDVDLAAELANSVEDPFTRDRLLIEVAEKCAEMDDDDYALQLADAVEDFGMRSQALEKIGLQKAAKGQTEKALEIADGMTHPDYVFAAVAVNQSASGNDSDAAETLEEIEYAAARVFALQTMAMEKLEQRKNDSAIMLLDQACDAAGEIEHDEEKIRTLCEIGNHFVEAGRNDKAIEAYDKAKEIAESLDNMHRDSFLAAASLGFLHAGSVDLADRTLDLITDKTQIASCLLGFARDYWQKEEKREALEALEEAYAVLKSQRDIETRDSRARFNLLASIATQFAGFGKATRGIEIADELQDENEKMSAQAQIAQILTIQKNDEFARRVVEGIGEDANRAFALIGMSDAAEKNGANDQAITLLDEASELVTTIPQLALRSSAYTEIAKRMAKFEEAERFDAAIRSNLSTILTVKDESVAAISLADLAALIDDLGLEMPESERGSLKAIVDKVSLSRHR